MAQATVSIGQRRTIRHLGRVIGSVAFAAVVMPVLRMVVPTVVRRRHVIDAIDGPVIIVANHTSHLDTPVLLGLLPAGVRHRVGVAAASDYFFGSGPIGSLVHALFGAFPFDRSGVTDASLDRCARLLLAGRPLVIFPEGTRSADGSLGRVRSGVARLAERCGVPVIPVHLEGLGTVMPKGTKLPLPGGVLAEVGAPIHPCGDVESTRSAVEDALAGRRAEEAA